ncbi:5-formyltetrahydrofolate cyclo-ligase [Paucibacter sp. KBW04]|uniref:5-formyltetrahydrofolate cyclo-ligase n=1 Tax=Paucibacter sp. KBW04 TaxID=2153361 RepID=UPI0018CC2EB2|nr:5-formyltetrahydrofolate cyclo-ligase [Paucibacter sp. KBW04]
MPTLLPNSRPELRAQLLADRAAWLATPASHAAAAGLGARLQQLLAQIEPQCLGLYWPLEGEFNAAEALAGRALSEDHALSAPLALEADEDEGLDGEDADEDRAPRAPVVWALPYAFKSPRRMDYRRWDGGAPGLTDECGIASSSGAPLVPDVVLVPCVGFTREGYRLGYGGGYFDRWLAAHPGVTSIGLAWSISETHFPVEAHDQALTLILTEKEAIMP